MKMLHSAWFPSLLGTAILFPSLSLLNEARIPEIVGLPAALGGFLLLSDGGFGLRVFPRLLSLARSAEEEQLPERMLYSAALGGVRYSLVLFCTLGLMLGLKLFGKADWLMWFMLATVIAYMALLFIHAKKAIELAGRHLVGDVS